MASSYNSPFRISDATTAYITVIQSRWRVGRKQAHALVSIRASQDKGRAWQERESVQLLHDRELFF